MSLGNTKIPRTENLRERDAWRRTVGDKFNLSGLTPDRIVEYTTSGTLGSVSDLTKYIAGQSRDIDVTNDGDGSVTLSISDFLFPDSVLPTTNRIDVIDNLDGTVTIDISNNFEIEDIPTQFADGSIPFAESGFLIEDNLKLFFDNTNYRLGVGTNTPDGTMHVKKEATAPNIPIVLMDNVGGSGDCFFELKCGVFPGNDNVLFGLDSSETNSPFVITSATGDVISTTDYRMVMDRDAGNFSFGLSPTIPVDNFEFVQDGNCVLVIIGDNDNDDSNTIVEYAGYINGHSGTGTQKLSLSYNETDDRVYLSYGSNTAKHIAIKNNGTVGTQAGRLKNKTRITSASSPYTILATDHIIFANTDTAIVTVNLPAGVDETEYVIKNTGTSGNDVTISPNGLENLIGANSSFALSDGESLIIQYDTTDGWY